MIAGFPAWRTVPGSLRYPPKAASRRRQRDFTCMAWQLADLLELTKGRTDDDPGVRLAPGGGCQWPHRCTLDYL